MDTNDDKDTLKEAIQMGVPLASGAAVSLGPTVFAIVAAVGATGGAAVFAARKFAPKLAGRIGVAKRVRAGAGRGAAGRAASGRLAGTGRRHGLRSGGTGGRGLLGHRAGKAGGLLGRSGSRGVLGKGGAGRAARKAGGNKGPVTAAGKNAAKRTAAAGKRSGKGIVGSTKHGIVGKSSPTGRAPAAGRKTAGRAASSGVRKGAGTRAAGSKSAGGSGRSPAAGGGRRRGLSMPFGKAARARRNTAGHTTTRNASGGHTKPGTKPSWRERVKARRDEAQAQRKAAGQMVDAAFLANRGRLTRDDDYDLTPRPDRVGPTPPEPEPARHKRNPRKRSTTMPDPFGAAKEAVAATRTSFDPDNATAVVEWSDGLPDYVNENVAMLRNHAAKILERVRLVPEYGEAVNAFTSGLGRLADEVAETGAILKTRHAEQLKRIAEQDPRDEAWDNSKNRPV